MDKTTYYELNKPKSIDSALIGDVSDNMDIIDTELKRQSDTDSAQESAIAYVSDGDTHVALGTLNYVYVKNHDTLQEGLYKPLTNIEANAPLNLLNVSPVPNGGLNHLKSEFQDSIASIEGYIGKQGYNIGSINGAYTLYNICAAVATRVHAGYNLGLLRTGERICGAVSILLYGISRYSIMAKGSNKYLVEIVFEALTTSPFGRIIVSEVTYSNGSFQSSSTDIYTTNGNAILSKDGYAPQAITQGQFVDYNGQIYTAKSNIPSGTALSISNLRICPDGGLNTLEGMIESIGSGLYANSLSDLVALFDETQKVKTVMCGATLGNELTGRSRVGVLEGFKTSNGNYIDFTYSDSYGEYISGWYDIINETVTCDCKTLPENISPLFTVSGNVDTTTDPIITVFRVGQQVLVNFQLKIKSSVSDNNVLSFPNSCKAITTMRGTAFTVSTSATIKYCGIDGNNIYVNGLSDFAGGTVVGTLSYILYTRPYKNLVTA